ncbi:MAG: hypothetical protein K2X99_03290, partial [Gemmatimonadaceae bacterium]|nr:hypothetical protein [Gemmatimonadaceae bacterium]
MTTTQRLARISHWLRWGWWARRALGTVAIVLASSVVAAVAGLLGGPSWLLAVVWIGAAALVLVDWLRAIGGDARAPTEVALWIEARLPQLRYALVTAADPATSDTLGERSRARIDAAPLERTVRQSLGRLLRVPAAVSVASAAILFALPDGALATGTALVRGDRLAAATSAARAERDPLAALRVEVRPPAYSGRRSSALDDPATVAALVGSEIIVEGIEVGVPVQFDTAGVRRAVERRGDRWRVALTMPDSALALTLHTAARARVMVLEPVADSAPSVLLSMPIADTVVREARGRIALAADAHDDLGLAQAAFEVIVSAGSGETFTFRTLRLGAQTLAGEREVPLTASLDLDGLALKPGDVVHLRATARDRNPRGDLGASETRSIRVARPSEYDSVAVEAAPPPEVEKGAMSQRMLLIRTQALVRRARSLTRAALADSSRAIARDQVKLRRRVGALVYQRLGGEEDSEHAHFAGDGHEHGEEKPLDPAALLAAASRATGGNAGQALDNEGDETPIVAINAPLLEAYNAMWEAGSALEVVEPARAIPPMQRAIAALQRARAAERVYLRGRPPRVVVDLARVRLVGKEKGADGARAARAAIDPERAAWLVRFDGALALVRMAPRGAVDSLSLLRA